jgi:hypothetical protein
LGILWKVLAAFPEGHWKRILSKVARKPEKFFFCFAKNLKLKTKD